MNQVPCEGASYHLAKRVVFATRIEEAMRTIAEAIEQGYEVDRTAPGRPSGTKGKIPNLAIVQLLTDLEEVLLDQLRMAQRILKGPTTEASVQIMINGIQNTLDSVERAKKASL